MVPLLFGVPLVPLARLRCAPLALLPAHFTSLLRPPGPRHSAHPRARHFGSGPRGRDSPPDCPGGAGACSCDISARCRPPRAGHITMSSELEDGPQVVIDNPAARGPAASHISTPRSTAYSQYSAGRAGHGGWHLGPAAAGTPGTPNQVPECTAQARRGPSPARARRPPAGTRPWPGRAGRAGDELTGATRPAQQAYSRHRHGGVRSALRTLCSAVRLLPRHRVCCIPRGSATTANAASVAPRGYGQGTQRHPCPWTVSAARGRPWRMRCHGERDGMEMPCQGGSHAHGKRNVTPPKMGRYILGGEVPPSIMAGPTHPAPTRSQEPPQRLGASQLKGGGGAERRTGRPHGAPLCRRRADGCC